MPLVLGLTERARQHEGCHADNRTNEATVRLGSSWFAQGHLRMAAVAGLIGRRQHNVQLSAVVS